MDLNRATIVGRLTRDPETRATPSGVGVTSFSVATNFVWNDQASGQKKQSVEYHNVVAWRKLGEIAGQYLKKGSRVLIEGRLQTRNWDGQDGSKRNRTEIVADNLIMLDSKGSAAPMTSSSEPEIAAPEPASLEPTQKASAQSTDSEEISVEDIPF
ncbi:MAG: single-stranded DNA-binding protein [bacterium]|nr:single-stranded DNA-binding protein [bacterium]